MSQNPNPEQYNQYSQQAPSYSQAPGQQPNGYVVSSKDDQNMAMLAHLASAILSLLSFASASILAPLVMWFIYAGYLVLRGLDLPPQRKRMICAVVGVVAFLDVPLVFLSARLWRSIHPAVFASKGGGLEPEMKLTAIACVAAMGLFWAGLVWLRTRQLGLRDRLDSLRLQAED